MPTPEHGEEGEGVCGNPLILNEMVGSFRGISAETVSISRVIYKYAFFGVNKRLPKPWCKLDVGGGQIGKFVKCAGEIYEI